MDAREIGSESGIEAALPARVAGGATHVLLGSLEMGYR